MAKKFTEAELAKKVITFLEDMKWNVWQEVTVDGGGSRRADIVAKQGNIIWVIECKTCLNLKVIEQAYHWRKKANQVSIAIWYHPRSYKFNHFVKDILDRYGIGLMTFCKHSTNACPTVLMPTNLSRVNTQILKSVLLTENKHMGISGSKDNSYDTPFKRTCRRIQDLVRGNPMSLKDIIESISHHYANDRSARCCIARYVKTGVIDFLVQDENGLYRLKTDWRLDR